MNVKREPTKRIPYLVWCGLSLPTDYIISLKTEDFQIKLDTTPYL
jgi:hypothetical protein